MRNIAGYVVFAIALAIGSWQLARSADAEQKQQQIGVPTFQVDPLWPRMEGNWIFGSIGGIAIDPTNDHVWVIQRPGTLDKDENYAAQTPPKGNCCVPASPIMEFTPEGAFVQGWGGPGEGYDWPEREHGITIDYQGNVWIAGAGKNDNQILKFTKAGKLLLQIGKAGKSTGSSDTQNLNEPSSTFVYPKTKEVFVSDGYVNRRIIVFDADSGKFKRMWGAYGNKPDDSAPRIRRSPFDRPQDDPVESLSREPAPQQFNLVHSVLISNDDMVYVAERSNNRIQVFKPDGTFIKEAFVAREMTTPSGSVGSLAFSADSRQSFLYVTGGDDTLRILNRDTLQPVGQVGRLGHYPGQFYHLHVIAVDSKGDIYTGENTGKRVQKFLFKGLSPKPTPDRPTN
jgi:DNA-binding beta-propeller fold protein YncE